MPIDGGTAATAVFTQPAPCDVGVASGQTREAQPNPPRVAGKRRQLTRLHRHSKDTKHYRVLRGRKPKVGVTLASTNT